MGKDPRNESRSRVVRHVPSEQHEIDLIAQSDELVGGWARAKFEFDALWADRGDRLLESR